MHPHDLGDRALCRWTQHRSQLLFARDGVAKTTLKTVAIPLHGATPLFALEVPKPDKAV